MGPGLEYSARVALLTDRQWMGQMNYYPRKPGPHLPANWQVLTVQDGHTVTYTVANAKHALEP